ncbi:MAG: hypothetical protein KBB24_07970 [Bacteroidales bacterium]|jgi:hypothetical protein|nr:hypothetical protein [Bacteroidales bacterium]
MKTGFNWVFLTALVLMALTAAAMVAVLTDLSLFRATPLLYTLTLSVIVISTGLVIRNRYYLPILRNLVLRGKLLLAPMVLLALTIPAALIYIYYDLTGRESLLLLSALVTSVAAAFFLPSMAMITLPALASVSHLAEKAGLPSGRIKAEDIARQTVIAAAFIAVILVVVTITADLRISGIIFLFPVAAIALMLLDIVIVAHFRNRLAMMLDAPVPAETSGAGQNQATEKSEGFMSVMLVADHYPDLIGGRLEYLLNNAGDFYAMEVISLASKTYDPALLPAMKAIASASRFSDKLRHEAANGVSVIEKYYSDPVRNVDLLRLPGIPEKAAAARAIFLSKSKPSEQEIIKLLRDASAEVRRTGLMAAGRYGMTSLRDEVMKGLDNPDTAREAYYVLRQFGPEVYGDLIGTVIRPGNSERENYIILRLLDAMPASEAFPWLSDFVVAGHMGVRLKAASSLCNRGWSPQGRQRLKIGETLSETIHVMARLIAMQTEVSRSRHFLLSAALEQERENNYELIRCLVHLLAGGVAAELILPRKRDDRPCQAGVASEAIESVISEPMRRPLKALLGNSTDNRRLAELSLYFPVRSVKGQSISSFLLASEQNITGTWSKACALHLAAAEGRGLDREHAISYLFSNSQILQEESARVIRSINPDWYRDAELRLPDPARARISAVTGGTLPQAAMSFEKTRFLSLCFSKIPEETMIMLASHLRYSGSYDAGSLPGVISWVVPSRDGKTGLYSIPVNDIAAFVFYYPEFTDIFVNYTDSQEGVPAI